MNWADLRILLAIGRADTMTAAGRALGLDQTTVSRRLEQLEASLSCALVVRDREGLSLTAAGKRLLAAAEQVETAVLDAQRDILGRDTELRGGLHITTADMFAQHHADLFATFAQRYPQVALQISTGYAQRSLARREADVALRFTDKPEPYLFGRKLTRFAYAPYAAAALVERVGRRARLERFPWLAWDPSVGARGSDRWLRKHVPGATIAGRFDAGVAMRAAAAAGLGVALMPCVYGEAAGLVRLRPPVAELGYDLWVLTHEDLRNTARVRAFLEHAAAYVDARRAQFEGTKRRSP